MRGGGQLLEALLLLAVAFPCDGQEDDADGDHGLSSGARQLVSPVLAVSPRGALNPKP